MATSHASPSAPPSTPSLDAAEAARLLAAVPAANEGLTSRTVGATLMLWGIVAGAIILAVYAFDARTDDALGRYAGLVLPLALAVAGVAASNSLWRTRAIGRPGFRAWRIWARGALYTLAAFAIVILLANYVFATNFAVVFTLAAGLLMGAVGIEHRRKDWGRVPWALLGRAERHRRPLGDFGHRQQHLPRGCPAGAIRVTGWPSRSRQTSWSSTNRCAFA
jgi:hypothetical protein